MTTLPPQKKKQKVYFTNVGLICNLYLVFTERIITCRFLIVIIYLIQMMYFFVLII